MEKIKKYLSIFIQVLEVVAYITLIVFALKLLTLMYYVPIRIF